VGKIKIEGLEELQKALKENVTMDDVKKVVEQNGIELVDKMQSHADFTKGYATGQTKRSIRYELEENGLSVTVGSDELFSEAHPDTKYAPYLEYGTRFMEAQPFVRPALNEQKPIFQRDMRKLVR
jgi:HK97 gp10 family phage protein